MVNNLTLKNPAALTKLITSKKPFLRQAGIEALAEVARLTDIHEIPGMMDMIRVLVGKSLTIGEGGKLVPVRLNDIQATLKRNFQNFLTGLPREKKIAVERALQSAVQRESARQLLQKKGS